MSGRPLPDSHTLAQTHQASQVPTGGVQPLPTPTVTPTPKPLEVTTPECLSLHGPKLTLKALSLRGLVHKTVPGVPLWGWGGERRQVRREHLGSQVASRGQTRQGQWGNA